MDSRSVEEQEAELARLWKPPTPEQMRRIDCIRFHSNSLTFSLHSIADGGEPVEFHNPHSGTKLPCNLRVHIHQDPWSIIRVIELFTGKSFRAMPPQNDHVMEFRTKESMDLR